MQFFVVSARTVEVKLAGISDGSLLDEHELNQSQVAGWPADTDLGRDSVPDPELGTHQRFQGLVALLALDLDRYWRQQTRGVLSG